MPAKLYRVGGAGPNLNDKPASLYETYEPKEARSSGRKVQAVFEFHCTPKPMKALAINRWRKIDVQRLHGQPGV